MSSATKPPPPRKKPFRKRYAVLLGLLGLILVLLVAAIIRGTWADKEPRDPQSSADGVICRLHQPPGDDWQVRCSMVLNYPADEVWAVVTDYNNFADIFPTLESCSYTATKNSPQLRGVAHSLLGDWPFSIYVDHEDLPGEGHSSHWEGASGNVQKIKGSWTVTKLDEQRTLLVYTSHVEIKRYPDWVVVNALLQRQPKVMKAVADWLAQKNKG